MNSEQEFVCDGCNSKPPSEHRCFSQFCTCSVCDIYSNGRQCRSCDRIMSEREWNEQQICDDCRN